MDLHTLTQITRSYVFLIPYIANQHIKTFMGSNWLNKSILKLKTQNNIAWGGVGMGGWGGGGVGMLSYITASGHDTNMYDQTTHPGRDVTIM